LKDLIDLFLEVTTSYSHRAWPLLLLGCAAVVLLWKLLETALSKATELATASYRKHQISQRADTLQELAIRRFLINALNINWTSCLPQIAKYHADAPLSELYHPLRYDVRTAAAVLPSVAVDRVLVECHSFAVLGPPGSGKSSLLNILAMSYARDTVEQQFGIKESRLPLFLELRGLPDDMPALPTALAQALATAGCPVDSSFLAKQLQHGRCIVLLDGLDESGDVNRRMRIVRWLADSMAAFPGNRFLVSCRTTDWNVIRLPGLSEATVARLSPADMLGIIAKWDRNPGSSPKLYGHLFARSRTL